MYIACLLHYRLANRNTMRRHIDVELQTLTGLDETSPSEIRLTVLFIKYLDEFTRFFA